jgi:hypothetical protein
MGCAARPRSMRPGRGAPMPADDTDRSSKIWREAFEKRRADAARRAAWRVRDRLGLMLLKPTANKANLIKALERAGEIPKNAEYGEVATAANRVTARLIAYWIDEQLE